ncbi:type II toxin-antitoxin system RatA family toxin [Novosphingobium mangrovi (ex Huang et al. 2023)]|uniref:Type II toxin-antitoxin system RatA family toxin n=1 Tax=Novosphingobium mangrovi (ex Huang et al. 2023) TaxID=2976432 RepID=A0ABT2I449_9SPHN|nr:type II toxin-antitoxin system RatA family toxin [Novosphingobium mangrovi (ex Huang et al. 2023)]MCT2399578.1 type II toxin-antitoxin system RatA family toxin [Novosphingobium mangrovi (ex Huang et al. 2023)]
MPGIHEVHRLPYSAEQMFDLVADVGRYQEFLPWVVATRVKSDDGSEMVADMLVGFKALREKFTSRVEKRRPDEIRVHYVDGPMRDLDNRWTFHPVDETSCDVEFDVRFSFRNALFEKLAGQYFDKAFRKMVAAFEIRAAELYGAPQTP